MSHNGQPLDATADELGLVAFTGVRRTSQGWLILATCKDGTALAVTEATLTRALRALVKRIRGGM